MKKYALIWLASYPKSGNTWARSFFSALLNETFDINNIGFGQIYSMKKFFPKYEKENFENVSSEKLEKERRNLLNFLTKTHQGQFLVKNHELFRYSEFDNKPIFQADLPTAAIYFVRNPLDITVSYARFIGKTLDDTIDKCINNPHARFKPKWGFEQMIGTWNENVKSWKNQTEIPTLLIRYEDLQKNPLENFKKIVTFTGIEATNEAIQKAVSLTEFKNLQRLEKEQGFRERHLEDVPFFHTGAVSQWQKTLTNEHVKKIIATNEEMMREFGYWQNF